MRMMPEIAGCATLRTATLKKGFVDELLFVQERMSMPEVLCLDAARIGSIRERVQRIVIASSLFLHACTIMNVRCTSLLSEEALSKIKFDKNEIMMSLKNNHSYDELYAKASSSILSFANGTFLHWLQNVCSCTWLTKLIRIYSNSILIGLTGTDIDDSVRERLLYATGSVLKGVDPVLSLMDKRVRDVFRTACSLHLKSISQNRGAPKTMRTGIGKAPEVMVKNELKELFYEEVTRYSTKLGFNVVADDVTDAAYDAFKVINHCVKVHDENVFYPIAKDHQNIKAFI
jgi:hypothetical protein